MQKYAPQDIRNFAVVGHASCGKTMLSEAMLACAGVIGRMGKIAEGSTVSDYHPSEKQRLISVQTSLLRGEWMGKKFNILDTPGYLDFISEALSALRVADFALVAIHAQHGIGVGTERVWNYATEFGIPKILVVNAMDKLNSHFDEVLAEARNQFGAGVFPMNLPINAGPGFNQVLDVLRNEVVTYDLAAGHGKFTETPATGELEAQVKKLHTELIEHIAESDDTLLTKYFDQGGLTEEELRAGIHVAVQSQHFIPLFCTAAEINVGVARLMDFIAKYGSSPVDRKRYAAVDAAGGVAEVRLSDPESAAYVFKTAAEPHFGELSFFRVYSGTLKPGMELYNSDRQITERIGQIYVLNGRDRGTVEVLNA
ncbi:MAG TPA: GTP-binding protein, partial [Candidatus Cybelea sp.]|nr:GTP-binding protein [Candidatus Cybelea sp.]